MREINTRVEVAMGLITLQKHNEKLRISLTAEGRDELQSRLDRGESIDNDTTFYDLLEEHFSGEWDWVQPDEIGALTAAPILSDDCTRDGSGILTHVGTVYWYESSPVSSPVRELFDNSHVDFQRAD